MGWRNHHRRLLGPVFVNQRAMARSSRSVAWRAGRCNDNDCGSPSTNAGDAGDQQHHRREGRWPPAPQRPRGGLAQATQVALTVAPAQCSLSFWDGLQPQAGSPIDLLCQGAATRRPSLALGGAAGSRAIGDRSRRDGDLLLKIGHRRCRSPAGAATVKPGSSRSAKGPWRLANCVPAICQSARHSTPRSTSQLPMRSHC
jgi:hypothetical protein